MSPGIALTGCGIVRARLDQLEAFRRRPGPIPEGWASPHLSRLRQSDGQTLAALRAVYAAIDSGNPSDPGVYRDWGILAAPRFLGRSALVKVLNRFDAEGVWGVTPHLIPQFALHSQSSTLSQVLGIRGPNLGICRGTDAAVQGLLTALTWLNSGTVPGVWLVLSGWMPEYVPDESGDETECLAIALGLGPEPASRGDVPRIRLIRTPPAHVAGAIALGELAGILAECSRRGDRARAPAAGPGRYIRTGSTTYRLDPGHLAVGGPIVIARGHGLRFELEPPALLARRPAR
jgi:hypothetical protein